MLFRTIPRLLPLLLGFFLLTGFAASERPAVSALGSTGAVFDRPENAAADLLPQYAGTDTPAALLSLRLRCAPNFRSATAFAAAGMCGIADWPLSGDYPTARICKPAHFRDSYRYYIYVLERMRI